MNKFLVGLALFGFGLVTAVSVSNNVKPEEPETEDVPLASETTDGTPNEGIILF